MDQLIDPEFVRQRLTREAPWCGSHGADGGYLGFGLVYYALAYALQAKTAVCLGSGGGFVPRLLRQAQRDLGIAAQSRTILVDGNQPEAGWGAPAWLPVDSFFRQSFPDVELLIESTATAATMLGERGIAIDYLHIDADHSFEGCLQDFRAYRPLLPVGAVVTLHDTQFDGAGVRHVVEHLRARGDCELVDFPNVGAGTAVLRIVAEHDNARLRPADATLLRVERVGPAPALAPTGRSWAYLQSQAFSVRSMVAASFLRTCDTVVELGAGPASIDQFLAGSHRSVIVVDPLLRERNADTLNGAACAVEHVRARFQDLRWHVPSDASYGLVLLGMEMQGMDEDDFARLYWLVDGAQATVIEFPMVGLARAIRADLSQHAHARSVLRPAQSREQRLRRSDQQLAAALRSRDPRAAACVNGPDDHHSYAAKQAAVAAAALCSWQVLQLPPTRPRHRRHWRAEKRSHDRPAELH